MTAPEPADVEMACEVMHDAYEKAALGAGWQAQTASRKPWADVPPANQKTMRAAVRALFWHLDVEEESPNVAFDHDTTEVYAMCPDQCCQDTEPTMMCKTCYDIFPYRTKACHR